MPPDQGEVSLHTYVLAHTAGVQKEKQTQWDLRKHSQPEKYKLEYSPNKS